MPFDASDVLTALTQAATSPTALLAFVGAAAVMLLGRPPARHAVLVRLRSRRRRS